MSAIPAKALLRKLTDRLSEDYETREAGNIAMELLFHFVDIDRPQIALNESIEWTASMDGTLEEAVTRLLRHEPLQHIVGEVEFYGLRIKTDERALIPRPETEELVDWVIKDNPGFKGHMLDIGTGTGCIPIALSAKLPKATVSAIDVSKEALALAQQNALLNKVRVNWQQMDVLTESLKGKYHIIVSNPPYIPESDRASMAANVLDFEPGLALFVNNDSPLIFYERIAALAWESLENGGQLFFEIHELYGTQVMAMLEEIGYVNLRLMQDLQGKDRMIKATKP